MPSVFATLNNRTVVSAEVCLPARGAWHASLVVDHDKAPTGSVVLSLSEGAVRMVGTVVEGGAPYGRGELLVVGGAGKLGAVVPARAYCTVSVRNIVNDMLTAAGEKLSASSDRSLLARQLPAWAVHSLPLRDALDHLCDALDAVWRVTAAGEVAVVPLSATTPAGVRGDVLQESPAEGMLKLSLSTLALYPGETWQGRRVTYVQHVVNADSIRTYAWVGASGTDKIMGALGAIVRRLTSRFDHHGSYPAEVKGQNGDGTLELRPDSPWRPDMRPWPGLSKVPIRGRPGEVLKVKRGARCWFTFEGGDPGRPVVTLFEPHSLGETTTTADKATIDAEVVLGGTSGVGVARRGDVVGVGGKTTIVQFLPIPGTSPPGPMVPGAPYKVVWGDVVDPTKLGPTLFGSVLTASARTKTK